MGIGLLHPLTWHPPLLLHCGNMNILFSCPLFKLLHMMHSPLQVWAVALIAFISYLTTNKGATLHLSGGITRYLTEGGFCCIPLPQFQSLPGSLHLPDIGVELRWAYDPHDSRSLAYQCCIWGLGEAAHIIASYLGFSQIDGRIRMGFITYLSDQLAVGTPEGTLIVCWVQRRLSTWRAQPPIHPAHIIIGQGRIFNVPHSPGMLLGSYSNFVRTTPVQPIADSPCPL